MLQLFKFSSFKNRKQTNLGKQENKTSIQMKLTSSRILLSKKKNPFLTINHFNVDLPKMYYAVCISIYTESIAQI